MMSLGPESTPSSSATANKYLSSCNAVHFITDAREASKSRVALVPTGKLADLALFLFFVLFFLFFLLTVSGVGRSMQCRRNIARGRACSTQFVPSACANQLECSWRHAAVAYFRLQQGMKGHEISGKFPRCA